MSIGDRSAIRSEVPEPETPSTAPPISVGQVLLERQYFAGVFHDPHARMVEKLRASRMLQLLDELIEFRRKEAQA